MKKLIFLSAIPLLLLCSLLAMGQQSGIPIFSAAEDHGIDTINLQLLQPAVNIPIRSKSGVIPFHFRLAGASSCFAIGIPPNSVWFCARNFLRVPSGMLGFTAAATVSQPNVLCPDGVTLTNVASHWVIGSADGLSAYYLPVTDSVDSKGCKSTGFTDHTADGSGFSLNVSLVGGNYQTVVTAANGTTTGIINGTVKSLTDTHGNVINDSGSVYTDTLATTALNAATANTYSWTDTNGVQQSITLNTATSQPLSTNFQCGGVHEENQLGTLLSSINYPDGTSLQFGYEAGYNSGSYTGRLGSITLRTGGTISYTYGALDCLTGTVMSLTRTTADGATTYTRSGSTTTVIDPGKNKTVYTFSGTLGTFPTAPVVTQVQKYQNTGTVASPIYTLLTTDLICYNGNTTSCSTASVTYPITQRDTYHTINSMATSSRVKETFNGYGNVTSVAKYDFGASSYTTQTSTTLGSWNGSSCVAVGSGIVNLSCDVKTTDSSAHTLSESRSTYNSLGSMTISSVWTGSSWLSTSYVPNANGTVASSTGPNGLSTTYGFAATGSGGCNGLLETSRSSTVASGDVLATSKTWNCDGPVILSTVDANGNGASYLYNDPLFRQTSFTDQSGFTTTTSYTATSVTTSNSFGSSASHGTASVDGLGRAVLTQKQQGPSSSNYDTVSDAYGFIGTKWQTSASTACTQTWGSGCGSYFAVSTFDPLGRTLQAVDAPGNGTVTYTYSNNDTGVTVTPAPAGENAKSVHTEVDGLGRTKSTCSILSSGGSPCGQGMSGSGILSTYAYSLAAGSTTVAVTRGSQTHTKVSDALGRLTSTTAPEAGTTQDVYDTQTATCGSSSYKGDLVETIDNAAVHICYAYDAANRLLSVSPASGTNCKGFIYGDNSYTAPAGVAVSNGNGHIVAAYTNSACNGRSSLVTDEWFSYDKNGRMTDMWEMTPHSGGYYHTTVSYFPNGVIHTLSGIPGYAAYTFGVDGEGRANTAVQGSESIVSGVTFNASSKPLVVSLGTLGDNDAYTYDPATGRMGTYTFSANGQTDTGTLTWSANGTLQQLAIVDGFNVGGTQTCTFGYDDVMRLVSDNCGSTHWSQTFSYDQYDNLTKTGNPGITWNPGYNPANNRYSTIGATYDSDGHLTYDSFNTYTWDAYGKMSSARSGNSGAVCGTSGTCVTYDASGRAAEKNVSGTFSEILYGPMGETAIMSGASTVTQSYISLPGGVSMIATGTGGTGQQQMEHHDWLGTTRLSTVLGSGSVVYDRAFAPYGENYDNFGSTSSLNFTGDRQDIVSGLFDTPNREQMPNQGRWISPDPAGQGWNLYAYPTNPNGSVDPSGLQSYSYSLGDLHSCATNGLTSCLQGVWGEAGVNLWHDTLDRSFAALTGNIEYGLALAGNSDVMQYVALGMGSISFAQAYYMAARDSLSSAGQKVQSFMDDGGALLALPVAIVAATHGDEGPIEEDAQIIEDKAIAVSEKGFDLVRNHLAQFGEDPPNEAMMQRLKNAFDAGQKVTGADANFYLHEASEATMMQKGLSYDAAHAAALQKYGVSPFSLYAPEVIQAYPTMFNSAWRAFWGLIP